MRRLIRLGVVLLAFAVGVVASASVAYAYSYNRSDAKAYADRYSCNYSQCRNSNYVSFGSDCTNFVSQALKAGGLPQERHAWYESKPEWFYANSSTYSKSWTVVSYFKNYMVNQRSRAVIWGTTMNARYNASYTGDVFMYDWGTGDGYSHLSFHPGYGTFPSYYDSHYSKNYSSVTGGYGDFLDQHSRDRYHAPWNWGYWVERNSTTRSKMRTVIIHFTP